MQLWSYSSYTAKIYSFFVGKLRHTMKNVTEVMELTKVNVFTFVYLVSESVQGTLQSMFMAIILSMGTQKTFQNAFA